MGGEGGVGGGAEAEDAAEGEAADDRDPPGGVRAVDDVARRPPSRARRAGRWGFGVPVVHAPAAIQAEVRDLEPDAVGVGEEGRVVVRRVLRVGARRARLDADPTERVGGAVDGRFVDDAEAEVMEPRRVGIVRRRPGTRRPEREAELAVVVVDVRLARERAAPLAEAEDVHQAVVEGLGAAEVADREVDVVDADHLDGHGVGASRPSATASRRCRCRRPAARRRCCG